MTTGFTLQTVEANRPECRNPKSETSPNAAMQQIRNNRSGEATGKIWNRASVLDVVLGEYRFGKGIRVFHSDSAVSSDHDLVEIHETTHLHLCKTTCFGLFQQFLGTAITSGVLPNDLDRSYRAALSATVQHSWLTHEGIATTTELSFALFRSKELAARVAKALPDDYRRATSLVEAGLVKIDIPIVAFHPVLEAVGFVALGTSILEDMRDHDSFLSTDWGVYFQDSERDPDERLGVVLGEMSKKALTDKVSGVFAQLAGKYFACSNLAEFYARFVETKVEDRQKFFDELREATISVIAASMPFATPREAALNEMNRNLVRSWFANLEKVGVKCHYTEGSPASQPAERLRVVLNELDYAPSGDGFAKGFLCVPFKDFARYSEETDAAHPLYVTLWHNPSDERVGKPNTPTEMKPGGGWLIMHMAHREGSTLNYVCPMQISAEQERETPLVLVYEPDDKRRLFDVLNKSNWALCVGEPVYRKLSDQDEPTLIFRNVPKPVVIVPKASTLDHWEQVLAQLPQAGQLWSCYVERGPEAGKSVGFLVFATANGDFAYARPTSGITYDALIRERRNVTPLDNTDGFSSVFSPEWTERLKLCCEHYYAYGW
jgi:hypothetical protein